METRVAEVSGAGRQVSTTLKRKQAACYGTCLTGETRVSSTSSNSEKRRKLHESDRSFSDFNSPLAKTLLVYYSNLQRSGSIQRLMYYENGDWTDFPADFVASIRSDFQVKNAATEVEIDGQFFLLDFLHMMRFDLVTGSWNPIAWIDEAGTCFFPEAFTDDCFCVDYVNDSSKHHDSDKIKVELEIAIDESEPTKIQEFTGESDGPFEKIEVNKPINVAEAAEVDFSCTNISDRKVLKTGNLNENMVRDMFLGGMSASSDAEIVRVYRGSGALLKARSELFMKQAEITKTRRGDANVRYAWLPSSKADVSNMVTYGIGWADACKIESLYGSGVHLVPANCLQTSAKYCDIDENGVKHMILCRVIMGNMELVHRGSGQNFPSSEDYDSGVDDLQNPGFYVVWGMNLGTHVYPEYVITFRVPSDAKGSLGGKENGVGISGVSTCGQLDLNAIPDDGVPARTRREIVEEICSNARKTPKSPWMPFATLFSAIENQVPPRDMDMVMMNYEKFRNKNMKREDFVMILRSIVGDDLLRSAIINLQCKVPPKIEANSNAPAAGV